MKQSKKLPIGIENFTKLQSEDFYYVDKTILIKEFLDNWAEVNLFTRPRRLEAGCAEALKQIEEKRYEELFLEEGIEHILKYGISFYKKKCKVELVI